MDPVDAAAKLTDMLKTGGAWALLSLAIIALVWLIKTMRADDRTHRAELKTLHEECTAAHRDLGEKARANDEAKNEKLLMLTTRFTEVTLGNTAALDRLAETIERDRDRR